MKISEILRENFADGKNPGRKGLAKRSGVNTKASVSSLRKTAKHSTGEKARMAHWLANMKAGKARAKAKKHESVDEGRNADVPVYYFAYGMLTDPHLMEGLELVGVGKLRNFKYHMYSWANVEPTPGAKVLGCLWAIDRREIARLDQAEGYPSLYDRRTYPVYCNGQKYPAEVYVMTPQTLEYCQGSQPSQGYVNRIVRGYRNAGIPLSQLQHALQISGVAKTPKKIANDPSPWADDK